MTPLQVLKKARKLLSKPEKWTQGWYYKDSNGQDVYDDMDEAVCFCAMGAIERSSNAQVEVESKALLLLKNAVRVDVAAWNDAPRRTHAQILRGFDKAIKLAQEAQ